MTPRFKINDIIALPEKLRLRSSIFFTNANAFSHAGHEKYCNLADSVSLDGKFARIDATQETLLGISVDNEDNFIYTATLLQRKGRRLQLVLPTRRFKIDGNWLADASLVRPAKSHKPRQLIPTRAAPAVYAKISRVAAPR